MAGKAERRRQKNLRRFLAKKKQAFLGRSACFSGKISSNASEKEKAECAFLHFEIPQQLKDSEWNSCPREIHWHRKAQPSERLAGFGSEDLFDQA